MYGITQDCPIECLAPLLSRQTLATLVNGIDGSPATVGQLIELYDQRRLMEIHGISTGRLGEIRRSLVEAKLIEADGRPILRRSTIANVETGRQRVPHDFREAADTALS